MSELQRAQSRGAVLDRSVGRSIFGSDAAGYNAHRLGYPPALYEILFERAGEATQLNVFEVGAGTGLATRDVLAREPRRLVVIEPDPALADHLATTFGDQVDVERTAFEDSRAEPGSFDLGFAAASFHWTDSRIALRQVRRLLRPGGCWAVWWNVYRVPGVGDEFADAVASLLSGLSMPPSEANGRHISLDRHLQYTLLREGGLVRTRFVQFRRERMLDGRAMRALYESYSFIRTLPLAERECLLDQIEMLVEQRFGGLAPNVVLTPLYIAAVP